MRSSKSRSRSKTNRPRTLGNIINRVFDSSGPEGKVRGTPQQIIEKYQFLARDAQLSNDRVAAENFQQHAEHYTRLLAEANRELAAEQEARGPQSNQGGQQSGQYGNQQNGNYNGQQNGQNGNQQNGNQQNGNNRDRQGDNRDFRNDQPRNDQPRNDQPRQDNRQDNRGDYRADQRPDNRQDNRSENRPDNRNENRQENRADTRSDNRSDQRPSPRSDFRAETRNDDVQPVMMAGLNDLADADTGLVATPEARPRQDRSQPRVRQSAEPTVEPVADTVAEAAPAPAVDQPAAVEAAPRKTRAPRKPKAVVEGGSPAASDDGQEAAE